MENHVIICGYGRNGQQVAKELEAYNQPYIVIDQSHDTFMKNMTKKKILGGGSLSMNCGI